MSEKKSQSAESASSGDAMERLLGVMRALRHPETGCPWDLEQSFETIAPYTIEEAYEVEDAIRSGDMMAFKMELGDLLFQTVFQSQLATEEGHFTFADVANTLSDKMINRHPHVFGNQRGISTADDQTIAWEERKAKERAKKAAEKGVKPSVLDDVPLNLPALMRAKKLQKRAARIGFDWPDKKDVLDKLVEESKELAEASDTMDQAAIEEEFGDLLFVLVNLGRHLQLEPETALRAANVKFERRFRYVEDQAGQTGVTGDLDAMEQFWQAAKKAEKEGG